ncbi:hypothetical protein I5L01_14840 [Erythrobacter sp. YJ-T3-07]|uniref:hypothetical protein n=1 Tax=Erythrobacter sp. YJ-T3-07 TaxID=2793063 RepID=UPI0018D2CA3B|nr:hypothetical protein [Erythrobacter sp. YJ-T3-07]MBH1945500.1 hypothetical protein [Erythrobacter sp. YJ-T3-07]
MFCPSAADWGNVADWVSGLGALLAVIVALRIAGTERRSAAHLRTIEANEALERRSQIKSEAIRIAGAIEAEALSYFQLSSLGGGDSEAKKHEVIATIKSVRSQLEALQNFPMNDPRLFTEIGRMVHESRIEPNAALQSTSHFGLTMKHLAEGIAARRNAMVQL